MLSNTHLPALSSTSLKDSKLGSDTATLNMKSEQNMILQKRNFQNRSRLLCASSFCAMFPDRKKIGPSLDPNPNQVIRFIISGVMPNEEGEEEPPVAHHMFTIFAFFARNAQTFKIPPVGFVWKMGLAPGDWLGGHDFGHCPGPKRIR